MVDILDNLNIIKQKDPSDALGVAASQFSQASFEAIISNPEHDNRPISSIVLTGMGGSALASLIVKTVLKDRLNIPLEVVRDYNLPEYVNENSLVIASSYSGNTEETLSALSDAKNRGAQLAIMASGGKLIEIAESKQIVNVVLPAGLQPRMAVIYGLKTTLKLLEHFSIITSEWSENLSSISSWLQQESENWTADKPTDNNLAKQLALDTEGKTPVFYGSPLTASLAYKYKISWNETSKNLAFWNEYSEFNHNEFMGWTSHPIEKPFVVFDIKSSFDSPRILQRFELSDRLLSGKRPAAKTINLKGETLFAQLVWGCILADFASIYAAILNGVDPVPVDLIERLKKELANDPR